MNIKYVVFTPGYAESLSVSKIIFHNNSGNYLGPEETLKSLASALFDKFIVDTERYLSSQWKSDYLAPCLQYGIEEEFRLFLRGLPILDADDFGDINGWWPWVLFKEVLRNATSDEILEIEENADVDMADMIEPEKYQEASTIFAAITAKRNSPLISIDSLQES